MFNDLNGLVVRSLTFRSGTWELTGNEIVLEGHEVLQVGRFEEQSILTIDCPLRMGGSTNQTMMIWGGKENASFPTQVFFRGPMTLNGQSLLVDAASSGYTDKFLQYIQFSGVIQGVGDLVLRGASFQIPFEMAGPQPNTFSGALHCRSGVKLNKSNGPVVNDELEVAGTVYLKRPGQIRDRATVRIRPEGKLVMEGHDTTITDLEVGGFAPASVQDQVSVFDMGGATMTLKGSFRAEPFCCSPEVTPIVEGRILLPSGIHHFEMGGSLTPAVRILAEITGAGGFQKTGSGSLVLGTNNSFAGSVSVVEGVVEAQHSQAFGQSTGGVTLQNGSLFLRNVVVPNETLVVRGTRSITAYSDGSLITGSGIAGWSGRIELETNLVVTSLGTFLVGGPLVGVGGLEFLGQQSVMMGATIGPNPSTFTGLTRVLCQVLDIQEEKAFRGPLIVGGGFGGTCEARWGFPARANGIPEATVHPNGWVNLNGRTESFTRLVMHGGRVSTGTGLVSVARLITFPTNETARIEGNLFLGSVPFTEFMVADGEAIPDLAVEAVITDGTGSISVHKLGEGELLLNGVNNYHGETQIRGGVVHVRHQSALGTTAQGTVVSEGATLRVESVPAFDEPLQIQGTGRADVGAALELKPAAGVHAPIVLAGSSTIRVDAQFGILSGVVSGTGPLIKIGAGSLQLGGGAGAPNTYSGETWVQAGELVLSKGDGVTTIPGDLVIGGSGGFLGTAAVVRHFAGNTIAGRVTVNRGGLWNINGFFEGFDLARRGGRPALELNGGGDVQTGAGTLLLPPGNVLVDPAGVIGAHSSISGRVTLLNGMHRFVVENGPSILGLSIPELDVLALLTEQRLSPADILKEGAGTMRLAASNSFSGTVTVSEGGLNVAHARALGGTTQGSFVVGRGWIAMEGGLEIAGETLTLDSTNNTVLLSLGPVTNTWSGPVDLRSTAAIHVSDPNGGWTHFGGAGVLDVTALSGAGGLTKTGPGTLLITGFQGGNTFTGPTWIREGILRALRRNSISDRITVSGVQSSLLTGRSTGLLPAKTVLPPGAGLKLEGGALWKMDDGNVETLSQLEGDGALATGVGALLALSNQVTCTFSGVMTGPGALNKSGLATFRVTGDSPHYTGRVTISDGTYLVDGSIPQGPITVKNSATLRGSGVVGDIVVENGGVVRVDPDLPGRSAGELVMNSAQFQSGGVLELAAFGPHGTGGNDHLFVQNGVNLANSRLSMAFRYPPRDGDVVTLIQKNGSGSAVGAFSGLPQGALRVVGGIPVVMNYASGDGNEVSLIVTNLPLRVENVLLVSSHGRRSLVPDDCGQLWIEIFHRGSVPITDLRGELRSLTPGVLVTDAESRFHDLVPLSKGSNTVPFQIRVDSSFPPGGGAQLELVLTSPSMPPMALICTLDGPSGWGLSFDGRGDRVQAATNAFRNLVNDFTMELWAKPAGNRTETAESTSGVVGVNTAQRQLQRFALFPDQGTLSYGAGHVGAGLSIGRNGVSVYEHGSDFLPSRLVYSNALTGWTHVAVVYANRRPSLYINGALVRSSTAVTASSIHPSASLGGSIQSVNYGDYTGELDEVRIWNRALSPSQIQSNMFIRLSGSESGLVTYFRCDEGAGGTLLDSAAALPNPVGLLLDDVAFSFPGVSPFGGVDAPSGGACESCGLVFGQVGLNVPGVLVSSGMLRATGVASVCDPSKPCPGFEAVANGKVAHQVHHYTNTTDVALCVTAQLRINCGTPTAGAMGVAAYLEEFQPDEPCSGYWGDDGGGGVLPATFSFRVPARTSFVVVVTQRDPLMSAECGSYALEVLGLPCPPPRLDVVRNAVSGKTELSWSTAYPDFRLQSSESLGGEATTALFSDITVKPVAVGGRWLFATTNEMPTRFFRLQR